MRQGFFDMPLVDVDAKGRRVDQTVMEIIGTLLEIPQKRTDKTLFSNKMPKKVTDTMTKDLTNAVHSIKALYNGAFAANKPRQLSVYFKHRNRQLMEGVEEKLIEVKGSWEAVRTLTITAARNYRLWFLPEYEPEAKKILPRGLGSWFYSSHIQASFFMACCVRPPFALIELSIDRVFASIDVDFRQKAEEFYHKGWNPMTFWNKMKDLSKWLYSQDWEMDGYNYWLGKGAEVFLEGYFAWLKRLGNGNLKSISVSQLGTHGQTWDTFLALMFRKYGIGDEFV